MGEKLAIINGRFCPSSKPEHAPFTSVVNQLLVLDPRKRCQTIPELMDAIRAIADNCQIDPSDAIQPLPVRAESPPKLSPSQPPQQPFPNSPSSLSIGDQVTDLIVATQLKFSSCGYEQKQYFFHFYVYFICSGTGNKRFVDNERSLPQDLSVRLQISNKYVTIKTSIEMYICKLSGNCGPGKVSLKVGVSS